MSSFGWVLDPTDEYAGTPLDINAAPYTVTGFELPSPPLAPQFATSVDSDGDTLYASSYRNRTVSVKLLVRAASDAALTTALTNLQQKIAKMNRDAILSRTGVGGVVQYTTPDGKIRKFDVCQAVGDPAFETTFTARQFVTGTLTFTCRPFWRGAEVALSDHTETSLPWLTFTETAVDGDVPAAVRIVVDDDQNQDQAWILWAERNRYRTSALTDRLGYQAESLTLQGGGASSTTTGAVTPYSSGTVRANALSTSPESIVSTQMTTAALTSVTGSDSTDIFTKASHGLTNDTRVRLSAKTGGSGLSTTTDYYVVNASTGFQLATTMGGSPVDLGSDVSSVTVTPQTHLTHVGSYRVFARVQAKSTNNGTVGVALEWGVGDFRRPTRNDTVYLTDSRYSDGTAVEGAWIIADLGMVRVPVGTSQWEGRILGWSTALNDTMYVDWLMLAPADEGFGMGSASAIGAAATSYTARSDFSGESGSPVGDSLNTGGTWAVMASAYETDDFSVTGGQLTRSSAGADTSTDMKYARWIYVGGSPGTASMTDQAVQVTIYLSATGHQGGVVARAADRDNFLTAFIRPSNAGIGATLNVEKYVAGVKTTLWFSYSTLWVGPTAVYGAQLRLFAYASGRWVLQVIGADTRQGFVTVAEGYDADLATGSGTLDDGGAGVIDRATSDYATTRFYDDFYCWAPVSDAVCFSGQSVEIASDGVTRENTGGTYWAPVSVYEGDLPFVPAGGQEARTTEFLIKMSRSNPYTGTDPAIDDLSAQVFVTPRGLVV